MACQALGRCRICARKHKIAVFGGEQKQHFFLEKANLKLIILNTVCVVCIGKIERFVKKMDLDMVFNDYIKDEDNGVADDSRIIIDEVKEEIVETEKSLNEEEKEEQEEESSSESSSTMDIDRDQHEEKSEELNAPNKGSYDVAKNSYTAVQARPHSSGDSHIAVTNHPHHSTLLKIGQNATNIQPRRKRAMNLTEIRSTEEEAGGNAKNSSNSSSTNAFVDCDYPSSVKKAVRLLQCDFCKKEFTHSGDLNKHRRKHTGEKPYECNQCQRKFAHASNLARHQRVHSGERPFVCTKCLRTFTRRDKLAIHITAAKCQINVNDTNSTQS